MLAAVGRLEVVVVHVGWVSVVLVAEGQAELATVLVGRALVVQAYSLEASLALEENAC